MTTTGARRPGLARRNRPVRRPVSARADSRQSASRARTGAARTRTRAPSASRVITVAGRRNSGILTVTFLSLTLFGLVMVLSASQVTSLYDSASPYSLFQRQAMWAAVGGVVFVVANRIDYRWLRPVAMPFLVLTVVLLIAVLIPGVGRRINGSSRWLGVGPFVVQPGEFAKLAIVLFTADLLGRRSKQMHRPDITIKPVMLIVGGLAGLLLLQPKLGTTIVIAAVGVIMLFVAGSRLPHLLAWTAGGVVFASIAAFASDYRRARLLSFRDPWADPLGDGLQTIQSWIGIASGGWAGVGLGAGRAKWGFLPYAHSDFIFAIVAEELGLIGAASLVMAFALVGYLGVRAAINAPDRFGMLLAAGLTSWLLVQAFMNIAMSIGLMPITGEPLPFVSAGGSSLVTTLAAAGVLSNIAKRSKA